tara:strand:- start:19976 stop:22003 length:2028 start_codon:yes stop_codon:yes gene_type:complete
MPFTQFTSLDFDEIKAQIRDYLRTNSNFSDFDFEGSNFSILIDTLAYNTYINAFNANLVANESFLDSASIRENVVSLARNIGYIPRSKTASKAMVTFTVEYEGEDVTSSTQKLSKLYLKPGLVCVGATNNTTYRFSITEPIPGTLKYTGRTTNPDGSGNKIYEAVFGTPVDPIEVFQGTLSESRFVAKGLKDQRFILDTPNIDSSTITTYVQIAANYEATIGYGKIGRQWKMIDNILNLDPTSEIFFTQEIQDERYELLFGDNIFGRKLDTNDVVTTRYIITDGESGNGAAVFEFQGVFTDQDPNEPGSKTVIPYGNVSINTVQSASNGSEMENLSSIKYYGPRLYSAQYRAVTPRDYEAIIQSIYPRTESIAVVGGEELDPPQFGKVQISIKPKNGTYISDFDKMQIKNKLKNYSIAGIDSSIIDLKILYVEIDSSIYYNSSQITSSTDLKSKITDSLVSYSKNVDINKFGGRFKYSKVLQLIDRVDDAITSNITKVKIRRDLKVLTNQFAQYELCFGNRFYINPEGFNIKSTGFTVSGESSVVYLTDVPNKDANGALDGSGKGTLSIITKNEKNENRVVVKSVGTVDYVKGEILINTVNITSTISSNNVIEIQAFPDSNDVVGLKDLYLSFDVTNSKINTIKDVIASGEDVSGVVFSRDYYTSSYSNGELERK